MKKTLKILFFGIFFIALTMSMTACDGSKNLLSKIDDLQAQLEQQEALLDEQDGKLKQQNDKIGELEDRIGDLEFKNRNLENKNKELEKNLYKLENSVPYEIGVIGTSGNILWNIADGQTLLVRSRSELEGFANQLNKYPLFNNLTMSYDGGTLDKQLILEWYGSSFFEKKAAVGCVFASSNYLSKIKKIFTWKDGTTLQIEIDYSQTYFTATEWVMVILEIDQSSVSNIEDINFVTNVV